MKYFETEIRHKSPLVLYCLVSLGAHAVLFGVLSIVLPSTSKIDTQQIIVRVQDMPKPPVVVEEPKVIKATPVPVATPTPKVVRKPRIRQDNRAPPPDKEVVEIRGGLPQSTSNNKSSIAVAQGNSAEVGVDPSAANRPPPAASSVAQPADLNVPVIGEEALADVPAKCPIPRGLELSEDAINAGVTSGEVIVEFGVTEDGTVVNPILKKGTGFDVDKKVLASIQSIKCKPAQVGGRPANLKSRKLKFIIVAQ